MNICITTGNTIEVIPISSLVYLEAYDNYSKVILESGKKLLSNESLKKFEMNLPDGFLRVHNSFIVNLNYVTKYFKSGLVELESGDQVPVARRRRSHFVETLVSMNSLNQALSA